MPLLSSVVRPATSAAILLATAVAAPVAAQSPGSGTHAAVPHLAAVPAAGGPALDGRLDDAVWLLAAPAMLTRQLDPDEGQPPSERTELRIVVGDGALYVAARMFDSEPARIVSRLGRRDEQPVSDRLTILLDARHDHLTAFRFDVYPAGSRGDAAVGSDEVEDFSWDPVWDVATRIDSLGWTAEIRIPLSQLRFARGADTWGIQVERFIPRKQELAVLSYVPKNEQGGPSRYAHLAGVAELPASRRVELVPFAAAQARYEPAAAGDPLRSGRDYIGSAGGDIKVGLGSDLTLDATINPDFGQVELDPAVVNLTAFETSFPEKRPFFVESADLFRFGQLRAPNRYGTPTTFFSRRIGRQPQGQITDPDARFARMPEQSTIAAAAKVTGKLSGGWSVAVLDAVTTREDGRFADAGGVVRQVPVEPLTNYFVGRARRELRGGNTVVGALLTSVQRRLDDPALAALLRSSAWLGGLDLNHSWGNRSWALDASLARTFLRGSPDAIARAQRSSARFFQRPDAERFSLDPSRTSLSGYAGQLALTKQGGGHWGGSIAYQEKSPGYETGDVGFTGEVGRRSIATELSYLESRPGPLFRSWRLAFQTGNSWNYDGNIVNSYVGLLTTLTFRNFWSLSSETYFNPATYDDQLTRGGPLARRPTHGFATASIASPQRGAISLAATGAIEMGRGGARDASVGMTVDVRAGPSLLVSIEPVYNRVHAIGQFVTSVDDPAAQATYGRRSVFATVDRRELALDTRVNWTFTPALSLQLYVQPFVSAGSFTGYKELRAPGTFSFDEYGVDRGTIARDGPGGTVTVDPDGPGAAPSFGFRDQDFNLRSLRANAVLRWEYRPGSTLFLVWQQARSGVAPIGDFAFRRDFGALFENPASNVLAVKATYWLGL